MKWQADEIPRTELRLPLPDSASILCIAVTISGGPRR